MSSELMENYFRRENGVSSSVDMTTRQMANMSPFCWSNRTRLSREELMKKKEEREKMKEEKMKGSIKERIKIIEEEVKNSEAQEDMNGENSLFSCCKQYKDPEKRFLHLKQHHDKDASKCVFCAKELSSKSSLDRHLLTHAEWQPYKCSHCNKQFSTNGNMHRHKKTHNGVCKGSKFVKKQKPSKECSPLKKSKINLKCTNDTNIRTESTAIRPNEFEDLNVSSEKRKRNGHETSENGQSIKKIKSNEIASSVPSIHIADVKNKVETSEIKTYPLSSHSESDVKQPSDDKNLENSHDTSSFPSKEVFITTLGLKTACRSEVKAAISVANSPPDCLIEDQESHKTELSVPETSLDNDEAKKQLISKLISKETLLKLQGSQQSLLNFTKPSTVSSKVQIEQSDSPIKAVAQPLKGADWLPESPETSIEGNLFELLLNRKSSDEGEKDTVKPQYFCQHCKKKFNSKIILKLHLRQHNKQKHFKCTLCGARLRSRQNATRHVVNVHKKRRAQAKAFIVGILDDVLSAERETWCKWCGQEFTSSVTREHHKRASAGCPAKPFICLTCRTTFSTKNNGKRHQFQYHKDEQADCIVHNVMAKNYRVLNPSTSSANIGTDDVPQESSVGSPSSSDSEHLSESELSSLPRKELDAAQSLIDMSASFPPQRLSDKIIDQSDINSSPTQNDSCFYLPIHTPIVQNKPLDLSAYPMDLSSKSNEDAARTHAHNFKRLPIFTFPISYKDSNSDTGIFHVNKHDIPSELPLNLVKNKEHNLDAHSNRPCQPYISFPSNSFESSSCFSMKIDEEREKCNNRKSPAPYECNLCSVSFSTNSNKRRHEKTKHLLHCKVPQKSKISFGQQITSTPKSGLSKKTKEALITKVSNLKPLEFEPVDFSISSDMNQPLATISNESENGDLASVSSLISTANSPQLKKYLIADNACDLAANITEAPTEAKEDTPKAVDQTLNNTKGSNKHLCTICKKGFPCKSSINRHSVIHTKQKNHHCQVCKKTFTTKSNRDRHMTNIHRLVSSRDNKKSISSKKQQKKSITLVPSESSTQETSVKDSTLPKELVNSDISQCNKENQLCLVDL